MTPDEYTIKEYYLEASDGYELYVHDWGNEKAKYPILYLHGGPGSNCKDRNKLNFDPEKQRVIFFDQRGGGKSRPIGDLKNNNTDKMVEDILKIIDDLKLSNVVLTGGSWGSTLALIFGIRHPDKVHAMILNGIFTARKKEIDYLDKGGFRTFFPDLWADYVSTVPEQYKDDPSKYIYQKVFGDNEAEAKKAAYIYSEYLEGPLLKMDNRYEEENYDEYDPSSIKVEMHYLKNNCFIPDNYVFNNAKKLTMPIWLVQGRYDMVCPPETAYELSKKLPNCRLIWTVSGHFTERESGTAIKLLQEMLTNP